MPTAAQIRHKRETKPAQVLSTGDSWAAEHDDMYSCPQKAAALGDLHKFDRSQAAAMQGHDLLFTTVRRPQCT